jgi:hypothetical protein
MSRLPVAPLDLSLYRGEDYVGTGTHRSSPVPSAPTVDISGWSIVATVKETADDTADALLTIAATLTDPTHGGYEVTITAAQSATLEVRTYVIDIWRVNTGAKTTLARGTLRVLQPVRTPA